MTKIKIDLSENESVNPNVFVEKKSDLTSLYNKCFKRLFFLLFLSAIFLVKPNINKQTITELIRIKMLRSIRQKADLLPAAASSSKFINSCFKSTSTSHNSKVQQQSDVEKRILTPESFSKETSLSEIEYGVPTRMMASEAFVEAMLAQGVTDMFGIVGSAFMDPLDIFPEAGIRFVSVQHEQNAGHMADGYARATGKHGVCIAQNGPGK